MRRIFNLKALIGGLVLVIIGGVAIYVGFRSEGGDGLVANIGYSLLASGLVALVQSLLVDVKEVSYAEEWGMAKIYETRMEKSKDSDENLGRVKQLDIVAFGLKTFRQSHTEQIKAALRNGAEIRILTMAPDSQFVRQREQEEDEPEGQIRNSIESLVMWADELNSHGWDGKITVKGYDCMTLDFYWRADGEIYFGPYWVNKSSQQTITFRWDRSWRGRKGFDLYAKYFEDLWSDSRMIRLTGED
jgi:hypothetical protein